MEWIDLLKAVPTVLGSLGGVAGGLVWLRRRRDAHWLERMKADIRREVEENLKSHETRLRVTADLKLRMHDRSWQLLRDLIGAASDADTAIMSLALYGGAEGAPDKAIAGPGPGPALERALNALSRVRMFAATAPPEYSLRPVAQAFGDAFSAALTVRRAPDAEARKVKLESVRTGLNDGALALRAIGASWNAKLWQGEDALAEGREPERALPAAASPENPTLKPPEHTSSG